MTHLMPESYTALILLVIIVGGMAVYGIMRIIDQGVNARRERAMTRQYLQTNIDQLILAMINEEDAVGYEMLRRAMAHTLGEYRAL